MTDADPEQQRDLSLVQIPRGHLIHINMAEHGHRKPELLYYWHSICEVSVLESSHIFGGPPKPAQFVGRELELSLLEEALFTEQLPREYRVIAVSGVGGQGKSSLLEQFRRNSLGKQTCIYPWALVDLSSTENREPQIALLKIRNQLRRFGLDSPAFDLAFARWHQFDRPGRELKQSYPEFFDKHESIVEDLADVAGELIAEVPGGGLVVKLLSKISDHYKEWWGRSQPILSTLDDLSITELSNYLPRYLGYDISAFVVSDPALRPTILFDSFESLWQQHGGVGSEITNSMPDGWVRDLVENTPGVLFLIAGRNRLHWSEVDPGWGNVIQVCELSELSEIDSLALLGGAGISAHTLQSHIFKTCEGHPLSLMLQIRIHDRLKAKGMVPSPEDFPTGQKDIINRFLNHVEPSFASAIKVSAIAEEIDADLWHFLSREF